jgi:polar amino acid transport system substrate-binding protein
MNPFWSRVLVCGALLVAGCSTPSDSSSTSPSSPGSPSSGSGTLRIGVTPDYQPLVFMQDGRVVGAEVDFGLMLGKELGREVEFMPVPWKDQIDALTLGKTDIIMSGMTKTRARGLKVAFSDPYLESGLRGICRQRDKELYDTPQKIKTSSAAIGVIAGTTADIFVQKYCPTARRYAVALRKDALFNLKSRDIDIYIDDGFAIADLYASSEAQLAALPMPLTTEEFAWGVRPGDKELLAGVNAALAKWKADGSLDRVIDRWMPYLKDYKEKSAKP